MSKNHFCFGASFFLLATSGTLLLTWTAWWLAVIGPSLPARRPFFSSLSTVPQLVQSASQHSARSVFAYSLPPAWPTPNSVLRLLAALAAVLCSFSFALLASLASHRLARRVFAPALAAVALLAAIAACLDLASIVKVAGECARQECVTLVPDLVLSSPNVCDCHVEPWFYFTLAIDLVLLVTALVCLALTVVPMIKRRGLDPSRTAS